MPFSGISPLHFFLPAAEVQQGTEIPMSEKNLRSGQDSVRNHGGGKTLNAAARPDRGSRTHRAGMFALDPLTVQSVFSSSPALTDRESHPDLPAENISASEVYHIKIMKKLIYTD